MEVLFKGPPGLGKTTEMVRYLSDLKRIKQDIKFLWASPTHALSEQSRDMILRDNTKAHIEVIKGFGAIGESGKTMCQIHSDITDDVSNKLYRLNEVCKDCHFFQVCEYQEQFRKPTPEYALISHAALLKTSPLEFQEEPFKPDLVVIDEESILSRISNTGKINLEYLAVSPHIKNTFMYGVMQKVIGALTNIPLHEISKVNQFDTLDKEEITKAIWREKKYILSIPGYKRKLTRPNKLWSRLNLLNHLLGSLEVKEDSIVGEKAGITCLFNRVSEESVEGYVYSRSQYSRVPTINISATPLLQVADDDHKQQEIRMVIPETVTITQIVDQSITISALRETFSHVDRVGKLGRELAELIEYRSLKFDNDPHAVFLPKSVRADFEKYFRGSGLDLHFAHFGSFTGSNEFENFTLATIISRNRPPDHVMEAQALLLLHNNPDWTFTFEQVFDHLLSYHTSGCLLDALGRLRVVSAEVVKKDIFIAANEKLTGVPSQSINRVTYDKAIPSWWKLRMARGAKHIPLLYRDLAMEFPEKFVSTKRAKERAEENVEEIESLIAQDDIVLASYRLPGERTNKHKVMLKCDEKDVIKMIRNIYGDNTSHIKIIPKPT